VVHGELTFGLPERAEVYVEKLCARHSDAMKSFHVSMYKYYVLYIDILL